MTSFLVLGMNCELFKVNLALPLSRGSHRSSAREANPLNIKTTTASLSLR